jgi:beta-phosphoglucomutase-like phosphatase (HAD superfamily)
MTGTKDRETVVRAFIFDMDGLLVETESIHVRAFEEFMRRKGLKPAPDYAATLVGLPVADNIEKMKRDFGFAGDTAALARERNALYLEIIAATDIEPLPGVGEAFEFALRHGLRKAVCSSSEQAQLDAILPRMLVALGKSEQPREYFDAVVSGDGIERLKPAPDIYLRCAAALGFAPGECLAFEDSLVGTQAAVAAGMPVVAVPNRYSQGVREWPTGRVAGSLLEAFRKGLVRADGSGRVVV